MADPDESDKAEGAGEADLSPRRFRLVDDVEIENLKPPEWLVDGVLPQGRLALLYGAPGEGKTFIALHLAFCVATGTPWFGRPVKQGPVVYVAAEGQSGLTQRVPVWKAHHGHSGMAGVHFVTEPVQLLEENHVTEFSSLLRGAHQPALVVIDTLSRCMLGGEEDSARDMGRLVQAADELLRQSSATILLVHHPTKDGRAERGSGALRGAMDTVHRVRRNGHILSLKCEKQKEADPHDPIAVALEPVSLADGRESCVVLLADAKAEGATHSLGAAPMQALRALAAIRDVPATSAAWRRAMARLPERTFYRAIEELVAAGLIEKTGSGRARCYRITDAGRCHCQ